jgi:hypothetical protein
MLAQIFPKSAHDHIAILFQGILFPTDATQVAAPSNKYTQTILLCDE